MGVALEKSSWPSILRFKRVPFCPFDCRRDIYQEHFWVLIFFFVTDRLVKAWDQCLCHQAAHIHTGDPDWWFSLVGDQNTEWFKFFFKVKFAVMVCFLSSHISVIILVRISTLSPYSKLIKSQDSSSHACNLTPDRLKFKLAGPPCVLLPCICLHGLGTYGQKIKVFV